MSAPKSILCVAIAVILLCGAFSYKLEIDASTQTLLLENDPDLALFREVSEDYLEESFLVVAYRSNGDILSDERLKMIDNLSADLQKIDGVSSVFSLLDAPLLQNKKISISELLEHVPSLRDSGIDINAARNELSNSLLYKNNLVSQNLSSTAILVRLKGEPKYDELLKKRDYLTSIISSDKLDQAELNSRKAELAAIKKQFKAVRDELRQKEARNISDIRAVLARYNAQSGDGDELFLGGMNMIASDMVDFVRNDLSVYGISVLVLLGGCLWLFFRRIRFVALPVMICASSAAVACGIFGLLGFEITVISSNFIALQLIITVSVMIHLIVAYREFAFSRASWSQKQLVYATLRERWAACFFAIFTTIIGFISLVFSGIKPVIALGAMMSVSISLSLIIAFVLFGSSLALMRPARQKSSWAWGERFAIKCAQIAINRRLMVFWVAIFLAVLGVLGASKLKVENSFIGYFKEDSQIYQGMRLIDTDLGGTIPLDVIIRFNDNAAISGDGDFGDFEDEFNNSASSDKYWFSNYKMGVIKRVDEWLRKQDFVGSVGSLAMLLSAGEKVNDNKALDPLSLALLYEKLPQIYKKQILTPYVNVAKNEARFVLRVLDSDDRLRRDEFINGLKTGLNELLKNDGVGVQISGAMVLYNNVLQQLFSSQADTFIFVVVMILAVFWLIFKSLKLAIIGILANLVAISVVFGVMGAFKIPLDIMSITIAAISLGIGVDDVVHYIFRFRRERLRGSSEQAVLASSSSIGQAMFYTSFAVFMGFGVMCFSNFWPTIYFGMLTNLVMAMMLLGALILQPALILSLYKRR